MQSRIYRRCKGLGTATGYLGVVVLALYINSPEVHALYSRPTLIWPLCVLLLYWISRLWMKAQRGEMHGARSSSR